MDIFSNDNFNMLPLTVDLCLKDESPFMFSKNGFSFVIKKHFVPDSEKRNDYRCCLLKIEILEGDVKKLNVFVASPAMIHFLSKIEYYAFTLSNIHQNVENVALTFNFFFNYKEQRIVNANVYITVPVVRAKTLKFGEYFCDSIRFPQFDNLTFETFWTKNMLKNGKVVYLFIIKNKKGVAINGFETDFSVSFDEAYYLNSYFIQPYEINFIFDLDEVKPKQSNFSNSQLNARYCKISDGRHAYSLSSPTSVVANQKLKDIPFKPSVSKDYRQQNIQNGTKGKATSLFSTPLLLKLLQTPPQKKLPLSTSAKSLFSELDENKCLKSAKHEEPNERQRNDPVFEILTKFNSSKVVPVTGKEASQKTLGTLKGMVSVITDPEHSNENAIVNGTSKTEELLRKLTKIYRGDKAFDSKVPETMTSYGLKPNEGSDKNATKKILKSCPIVSSDNVTSGIPVLFAEFVKCTKCQEFIKPSNADLEDIPQKYCTCSNSEHEIPEVSKTIPSTLKDIAQQVLEKEKFKISQDEKTTTKLSFEIPVSNSEANVPDDVISKTWIAFVTSDGNEIKEDADILCNASPVFNAIFDSSDKEDCKIDTKFSYETISHTLNYLRKNDEKFLKGYENEICEFASEYGIKCLKINAAK